VEGAKSLLAYYRTELFQDYDVLVFTETFARHELDISGFYGVFSLAEHYGGIGRPKGGIACFVKPHLAPIYRIASSSSYLCVRTRLCDLIACYFPPDFDAIDVATHLTEAIEATGSSKSCFIIGDMNCRIDQTQWPKKSQDLLDICHSYGFELANDLSALTYLCHNGSSLIDLLFYRPGSFNCDAVGYAKALLPSIRKHQPMLGEFSSLEQPWAAKTAPATVFSRRLDASKLCFKPQSMDVLFNRNVDSIVDDVLSVLKRSIIPRTEARRRHSQVWFDTECYLAKKMLLQALTLARLVPDMRPWYNGLRRMYKRLLDDKRALRAARDEAELISRAEKEPYRFIDRRSKSFNCPIPVAEWHNHFAQLLHNPHLVLQPLVPDLLARNESNEMLNAPVTHAEISRAIVSTKNGKATGIDMIAYEHLKASLPQLGDVWCILFNACLLQGKIPDIWRLNVVSVLYKNKGPVDQVDSYRGISKESCIFKIFTRILADRLLAHCDMYIPPEQYGFRKGKSTLQAIDKHLTYVNQQIATPGVHVYAVYIDFRKAFDSVSRQAIISTLIRLNVSGPVLGILHEILRYNLLRICDGLLCSEDVTQNVGVVQGDSMSPILFVLLTIDLIERLRTECPEVEVSMFADDLEASGTSREAVQRAVDLIDSWAKSLGMSINIDKTKAMKFRKGGRLARDDVILIDGKPIEFVKSFTYLGVTIASNGKSFREHIATRVSKALTCASCDLKNPSRLSLPTALKLFDLKVAPVATYAIPVIWKYLSVSDLLSLDRVKTAYLKRVMCLARNSRNRLVYLLAGCPTIVEQVRKMYQLEETSAYVEFMEIRNAKLVEVGPEFYVTPAMLDNSWKAALFRARHVYTRYSIHGFHHRMCTKRHFHYAELDCVCANCNGPCSQYHLLLCENFSSSLRAIARHEPNF
jgi:hypothetical protein